MEKETAEEAVDIARRFMSLLDENEYHNTEHAEEVAEVALELAEAEGYTENQKRLTRVAAWFHDVGHIAGSDGHEMVSSNIAQAILHNIGVSEGEIFDIRAAIRATEVPQRNESLHISQVLADADLASLGYDYHEFYKRRMDAYKEWDFDGSPKEWNIETGLPLLEHMVDKGYNTDTAQERYYEQAKENYERLKKEVNAGAPTVLVGGTFDYFHEGHLELLETAFGHGNPIIGVTSDELANESRDREVSKYQKRERTVSSQARCSARKFERDFEVTMLNSKTDVAAVEADAEIIVVSPEEKTIERAKEINELRAERGLDELEIIVCNEVRAEDGGRISSTRINNGEIYPTGELR